MVRADITFLIFRKKVQEEKPPDFLDRLNKSRSRASRTRLKFLGVGPRGLRHNTSLNLLNKIVLVDGFFQLFQSGSLLGKGRDVRYFRNAT
jgi:hypothetical protein